MLTNNFAAYSVKILTEFAVKILYFPLWWYSKGLVNLLIALKNFLASEQKSLGLLIWIKNIFTPMYGQYDWQGRLISFFIRLVQIILRSAGMLFWLAACLAILAIWLIAPVFIFYQIIYQLLAD